MLLEGDGRAAASLADWNLRLGRTLQFVRFGLVGASGVVVNTVALYFAVNAMGIHYLIALFLATQASTMWSFILADVWVFENDQSQWSRQIRFGQFWLLNNSFLLVRGPVVWLLTDLVGLHYISSNLVSMTVFLIARYGLAERLIWRSKPVQKEAPPATPVLATDLALRGAPLSTKGSPLRPTEVFDFIPRPDRSYMNQIDTTPPSEKHLEELIVYDPGPSQRNTSSSDSEIASPHLPQRDRRGRLVRWVGAFLTISIPAVFFRVVFLNSLGLNSDEAVYAGQAASITGDAVLTEYFPIFRAHPLLFQTTLSVVYQFGVSPLAGRLLAGAFGLGTVWVCYLLGKTMYGRRAGALAAMILAVMPYHVVVTRQILLDGPMVFFATCGLFLLARFAQTQKVSFLYASAATMGLTALTNERSVVMLGGIYLFFALVPSAKVRFHRLIISMVIFVVVITPYPLSVFFAGKSTTGEQFLAWQLFRRANHDFFFYPATVPPVLGLAALAAAAAGLVFLRHRNGWREVLLFCWCIVPLVFFQIWPVKGFQYLLVLAPPVAVLAGRALAAIPDYVGKERRFEPKGLARLAGIGFVVITMATSSFGRISPAQAGGKFLAGSGGVPGGREAGEWVGANLPEGSTLLAIGPSMANIIQWYGDRKTFGLSVSPNPLHRNPVYEPVSNPDHLLRNGDLHYLVWDSFSASRSEFFSERLLTFTERYHGRIIHQEFVDVTTDDGGTIRQPVIIIYEVRP